MINKFDWDNPFRPEDFLDSDRNYELPPEIANRANARFREIIKEHGMLVFCHNNFNSWHKEQPKWATERYPDTHSAILICEKKLDE